LKGCTLVAKLNQNISFLTRKGAKKNWKCEHTAIFKELEGKVRLNCLKQKNIIQ
jgi:hypothetical protein